MNEEMPYLKKGAHIFYGPQVSCAVCCIKRELKKSLEILVFQSNVQYKESSSIQVLGENSSDLMNPRLEPKVALHERKVKWIREGVNITL